METENNSSINEQKVEEPEQSNLTEQLENTTSNVTIDIQEKDTRSENAISPVEKQIKILNYLKMLNARKKELVEKKKEAIKKQKENNKALPLSCSKEIVKQIIKAEKVNASKINKDTLVKNMNAKKVRHHKSYQSSVSNSHNNHYVFQPKVSDCNIPKLNTNVINSHISQQSVPVSMSTRPPQITLDLRAHPEPDPLKTISATDINNMWWHPVNLNSSNDKPIKISNDDSKEYKIVAQDNSKILKQQEINKSTFKKLVSHRPIDIPNVHISTRNTDIHPLPDLETIRAQRYNEIKDYPIINNIDCYNTYRQNELYNDDSDDSDDSDDNDYDDNNNHFININGNINAPVAPINMAEIITNVLQDVIQNTNITINSVVEKIKALYESKKPTNKTQSQSIILINFENDTFMPVLEVTENYLNIIHGWYEMCDLLVDFEETNLKISEDILTEEVKETLYKPFNCESKENFITEYIPIFINYLISQNEFNNLKKKLNISTNNSNNNEKASLNARDKILTEYNIIVPNELVYTEDYFYKEDNKHIVFKKSSITVDDEINNKPIIESPAPPLLFESYNCISLIKGSYNYVTDGSVAPFNTSYDCLNPFYGSNCEVIINTIETPFSNEKQVKEIKDEKYKNLCVILYNYLFNQTIVLHNPTKDELFSALNCTEYGFIELFTINIDNQDIIDFIDKKFLNITFENEEELNKLLETTLETIKFMKEHSNINNTLTYEEKNIKAYFTTNYVINTDLNCRMKASILYDMIMNEPQLSKFVDKSKQTSFKNRLSKYLKEIGLQKKRYNDGYYYYGIRNKETDEHQ